MKDKLADAVDQRRELAKRIEEMSGQIDALQMRVTSLKDARQQLMLTYQGLTVTIKTEAGKL